MYRILTLERLLKKISEVFGDQVEIREKGSSRYPSLDPAKSSHNRPR